MAEVDGQGGVEKTPFRTHGLGRVLESRGNAAEVLRNTEMELGHRVQTFLEAKIGKCRENGGVWDMPGLDLRIEGEDVIISGVSYYQYGVPVQGHQTGIHIITLLKEGAELPVSRLSDAHHAPLVITVPLAEFNQLTGVEEGEGYDGDDCGAAARAAHQVVRGVGGQAMEVVGFSVADARRSVPRPFAGPEM